MAFYDKVKETMNHGDDNKIYTTNGAIAYASAGDSLVDFSYAATSLRNKTPEQVMALFERCYIDNPMLATKMMFQMGDVREGKGERRTFNTCLRYMALAHPEIAKAILPLVPEYTRWDHVAEMCTFGDASVQKFARQFMAEQLRKDYDLVQLIAKDNERRATLTEQLKAAKTPAEQQKIQEALAKIPHRQLSLCAKWAPALGSKKAGHHKIALKLIQEMGITNQAYRKMRSAIISHLNVAEQALSAGKIESINLEHMTSAQQAKYAGVMKTKNAEAYEEYLDKVEAGEAKMNAQVLTPATVVHNYSNGDGWGSFKVKPYDRTLENLWKNLKQVDVPAGKSCIVVRDDSGSMTCRVGKDTSMTALEVATALAIYCAERLPGEFKDKFISFSANPKFLDLTGKESLHDRLQYAYKHSEVSNTDVKAVFDLLLKTALRHNMKQEDLPGCVLMLSDMEFDAGTSMYSYGREQYSYNGAPNKALFEEIRDQWKAAGYEMPVLAFWNLNANRAVVPMVDDRGVVLLSGFTTDNLDMVMNGDLAEFTPAKQLEMVLSKPRYDAVETAFRAGLEAEHRVGTKPVTFAEFIPEDGYVHVNDASPFAAPSEYDLEDYPDEHDEDEW